MSDFQFASDTQPCGRGRLIAGGAIILLGALGPLFVPWVGASGLPAAWKLTLSGLLVLGIPELFLLIGVAVLGKSGFESLKRLLFEFFRRHAPAQHVSATRYRVGLLMFCTSLLFGWIGPYVAYWFPAWTHHPVRYAMALDALCLASLFVLGGEFWDKLRALFVHGARAQLPRRRAG